MLNTFFLRKFKFLFFTASFFLVAFAQAESWEELDEVNDVLTRTSTSETHSGKLEGMFLDKLEELGKKDVNVHFIFSDEPVYGITYFNYYDSIKKALVLDFYDSNIGSSILDSIIEYPIVRCEYEEVKIDFNKGISGLKPDIRDMVRISLFTDYNFPYTLGLDEFEVLTLNFAWSKEIEKQLQGPSYSSVWMFLIGTVLIGGLAAGTFFLL